MATSVNGYIAKVDHETPWTEDEFSSYTDKVREVGNLVVGKTTFELMLEENAFADLGEPFVVVLTSSQEKPIRENTIYVDTFDEAINTIAGKGFSTALIGGGGKMDSEALRSGKLDELYIDIEPVVFGKGIPLFAECDIHVELKMIDSKRIGESGCNYITKSRLNTIL
jgi:dihydrofolate reductase